MSNKIVAAGRDGIQIKNFRRVLVDNNDISGVKRSDPTFHSDALQSVFGGHGLIVRRNFIHDNAGGIIIKDGRTTEVVLENNIIAANVGDGASYGVQLFDTVGARIANNTVWANRFGLALREGAVGTELMNNIVQELKVIDGATISRTDRNLIGSTGGSARSEIRGRPVFVRPESGNFRLASGSPGVDSGTSREAPVRDRSGKRRRDDPNTRNSGTGPVKFVDLGAYER